MSVKYLNVSKPARYIGGELNSIVKEGNDFLNFCLIFSDIYEIGTSHIGYRLLYELVNKSDKVYCQRFFAPWKDALDTFGKEMFVSLENRKPLDEFDVLGFSLHYEMSYTTTLAILKYSNIPLRSKDRIDDYPIILAGGSCTYNPAPLKPFMDIFYIGEGDIGLRVILEHIKDLKDKNMSKMDILKVLNDTYEFLYIPLIDDKKTAKRDIFKDFNHNIGCYTPIVPSISAIQDRVSVEIARGCTAGCRFCQAGMIYRPVRERNIDLIIKDALSQVEATGYLEVSLLSLSTGDFSQIEPLIMNLNAELEKRRISLSTPSLRANSVSDTLFKEISKVRKSGFTIAPEAGSERMRRVINKNLTEEDILKAVVLAAENGYHSVKLYFMIGLPFEEDEDILGIADLASKIKYAVKQVKKGTFDISVSVSHFVPKAHTPFQRFGQVPKKELERRMYLLKDELRRRKFRFKFHDTRMSTLEAVVSRGDEKVADLLEHLVSKGCYLDAWDDFCRYDKWVEYASEIGFNIEEIASKSYSDDDILPWHNISTGVKDEFYKREVKKAKEGLATVDCRNKHCSSCGVCDFDTLKPRKADNTLDIKQDEDKTKEFIQYEVIYKKFDTGVYFSALDLSRIFTHSLLVSGIELNFSQGFNPHPKINTWIPIPVGMKGENEVMSFEGASVNLDTFLDTFNKKLPYGLEAKSIKKIDTMKSGTEFISLYKLFDKTKEIFDLLIEEDRAFYMKKDKKGNDKKISINDYMKNYNKDNGEILLIAGNGGGFNLIELLKHSMDINDINITRLEIKKYEES